MKVLTFLRGRRRSYRKELFLSNRLDLESSRRTIGAINKLMHISRAVEF